MSLSQQQLFPQKYVTIATDISLDRGCNLSAWACYIRYEGGVIHRSGLFSAFTKHTGRAETYALCNALVIAEKMIPTWGESRIIIYNEIEHALTPIKTKSGNLAVKDIDRAEAIINIALPILDKAQSWDFRKIKAHKRNWQKTENPAKYAINRWCDREARRVLREARKRLKKGFKVLDTGL